MTSAAQQSSLLRALAREFLLSPNVHKVVIESHLIHYLNRKNAWKIDGHLHLCIMRARVCLRVSGLDRAEPNGKSSPLWPCV